ncbi:hypothetical protein AMTR_s00003p00271390 [Amborella trichopoda]|uniref:Uncharacterized protein n=1 Tax=Amborella trichopoda TaxID=13333 RepID=W1P772_AMBTC|nr:hypothetical protein AMTR_s00003p00271390 [Amborella trichopoda]
MAEENKLFKFRVGLKPMAQAKIRQYGGKDLPTALIVTESFVDLVGWFMIRQTKCKGLLKLFHVQTPSLSQGPSSQAIMHTSTLRNQLFAMQMVAREVQTRDALLFMKVTQTTRKFKRWWTLVGLQMGLASPGPSPAQKRVR